MITDSVVMKESSVLSSMKNFGIIFGVLAIGWGAAIAIKVDPLVDKNTNLEKRVVKLEQQILNQKRSVVFSSEYRALEKKLSTLQIENDSLSLKASQLDYLKRELSMQDRVDKLKKEKREIHYKLNLAANKDLRNQTYLLQYQNYQQQTKDLQQQINLLIESSKKSQY